MLPLSMPAVGSITLEPAAIHRLSNHFMVILGFIELMLVDLSPDDPHRSDLIEVRTAAVEAAKMISHTHRNT